MNRKSNVKPFFQTSLPDSAGALSLSPHAQCIAVATLAGPVLLLNRTTGHSIRQTPGHPGGAFALAHHPTADLLVTAGQDGSIQWIRGDEIRFVRNATPQSPVSHLAWSSDGSVLAAAAGRMLLLYDAQGVEIGTLPEFASTLLSLSYSPARECFVVACYGGVHLVNPKQLPEPKQLFARTSIISAAASPCGRFIAAGAQEPVVRIWDLQNDDECVHLEGYRGKVSLLQWGAAHALLATASGNSVVLWSFANGDPHATPHVELSPHPARVLSLVFSPDGKSLWTGCADGQLRHFDLEASLEPIAMISVGAPVHLVQVTNEIVIAATTGGTITAVVQKQPKSVRKKRREEPLHP